MSTGLSLLLAIVISLGLSATLVAVLWAPLQRLLATLCSTGEASQFWVSFTSVMLFLAPLTFSVFSISPRHTLNAVDAALVLRSTLLASLLGAVLALMTVGLKLANARPQGGTSTPAH